MAVSIEIPMIRKTVRKQTFYLGRKITSIDNLAGQRWQESSCFHTLHSKVSCGLSLGWTNRDGFAQEHVERLCPTSSSFSPFLRQSMPKWLPCSLMRGTGPGSLVFYTSFFSLLIDWWLACSLLIGTTYNMEVLLRQVFLERINRDDQCFLDKHLFPSYSFFHFLKI